MYSPNCNWRRSWTPMQGQAWVDLSRSFSVSKVRLGGFSFCFFFCARKIILRTGFSGADKKGSSHNFGDKSRNPDTLKISRGEWSFFMLLRQIFNSLPRKVFDFYGNLWGLYGSKRISNCIIGSHALLARNNFDSHFYLLCFSLVKSQSR